MNMFRNPIGKKRTLTLVLAFVFANFVAVGLSCSIPVFRYALEHWLPEPYIVHLIFDREMTPSDKAYLSQLQGAATSSNYRIQAIEFPKLNSANLASDWERITGGEYPSIVVEAPKRADQPPSFVWKGELSQAAIEGLIESPLRKKIAESLATSSSVTWVFLDGENAELNSERFQMLESELARLENVIKLPVIDEEDRKDLLIKPEELSLHFTAHRLSSNDPKEELLISMLLATESDLQLESKQGEPIAFPIFGRGRVLYALVGKGISPQNIEEASRFLAGACQCTVKAENPGVDLLIHFDWSRHVRITVPKKEDVALDGLGPIASLSSNASKQTQVERQPNSTISESNVSREDVVAPVRFMNVIVEPRLIGVIVGLTLFVGVITGFMMFTSSNGRR